MFAFDSSSLTSLKAPTLGSAGGSETIDKLPLEAEVDSTEAGSAHSSPPSEAEAVEDEGFAMASSCAQTLFATPEPAFMAVGNRKSSSLLDALRSRGKGVLTDVSRTCPLVVPQRQGKAWKQSLSTDPLKPISADVRCVQAPAPDRFSHAPEPMKVPLPSSLISVAAAAPMPPASMPARMVSKFPYLEGSLPSQSTLGTIGVPMPR